MSESSSFRIEGSWRAWRGAFLALGLLSAGALAYVGLTLEQGCLLWLCAAVVGVWASRWSLRTHRLVADGADGVGLVWADDAVLPIEQLAGYGPVWMLCTARARGIRRCAVLAAFWSQAQRREFMRRWSLRSRDSAPSV